MKTLGGLLIATCLALGSGCARPDWIEATLVTVDVSGVWSGKAYIPHAQGGPIIELWLDIQQQGPKVKGTMRPSGALPWRSGPIAHVPGAIEGTVTGDVLRFRDTSGSLTAELTVSDDEMTGEVTQTVGYTVNLRRLGPATPTLPPPRR